MPQRTGVRKSKASNLSNLMNVVRMARKNYKKMTVADWDKERKLLETLANMTNSDNEIT